MGRYELWRLSDVCHHTTPLNTTQQDITRYQITQHTAQHSTALLVAQANTTGGVESDTDNRQERESEKDNTKSKTKTKKQ